MNQSKHVCPLCGSLLVILQGTRLNPQDGITLACLWSECPAQEVEGHGRNEEAAFEIIQQKYKK